MPIAPTRSRTNAFLALAAFVALAAGLLLAVWKLGRQPEVPGLLWPDPPQLGHFALTGDDGEPLTEADLRGRWTLLFFGFTHCPDVCPSTLAVLKQVKQRMATDSAFGREGQVLFVSVDPARDTPEALARYVKYFDPRFRGATGDDDALYGLTRQLGVIYAKVPGSGENDYSMDHTASIFVVDPSLRVLSAIGLPHDAADITARVRAIEAFVEDER
ncbi:MAG TPA: SCO family protein [Gammaproteobacteria bacterium]|nr:SCO family protein [Gammaproteobacteria bacterium]